MMMVAGEKYPIVLVEGTDKSGRIAAIFEARGMRFVRGAPVVGEDYSLETSQLSKGETDEDFRIRGDLVTTPPGEDKIKQAFKGECNTTTGTGWIECNPMANPAH